MDLQSRPAEKKEEMKADVIIVGAGPAGSTVAAYTAAAGVDTLILEKEKEIGKSPCAGYISAMDYPDISSRVIQSRITGMKTYTPTGKNSIFPIKGFNVDRKEFDNELAAYAVECGSQIITGAEVSAVGERGVELRDGRIIEGKVVVGADGPFSIVAKYLGFSVDYVTGVQYEVHDCVVEEYMNEIFFDFDYSPGCYVWIFPSGEMRARVGLAVRRELAKRKAKDYLDSFIDDEQDRFSGCSKTSLVSGAIPVGGLPEKLVEGNILLVGDAAGMADPVTGAGISYALTSGRIAANAIIKAVKKDDLSILERYDLETKRVLGNHYEHSLRKRKQLDSIRDNKELEENLEEIWPTYKKYWRS